MYKFHFSAGGWSPSYAIEQPDPAHAMYGAYPIEPYLPVDHFGGAWNNAGWFEGPAHVWGANANYDYIDWSAQYANLDGSGSLFQVETIGSTFEVLPNLRFFGAWYDVKPHVAPEPSGFLLVLGVCAVLVCCLLARRLYGRQKF